MAPSKRDPKKTDKKKTTATGSKAAGATASRTAAGASTAAGGARKGARSAAPSGASASRPRKAAASSGLRVASSRGTRGQGKAAASGSGAGSRTGIKKAAAKGARKVPVGATSPVIDRPGVADSRVLAEQAIEIALDKKALMPVLIDVSAMASYTDFIAVLSGKSDRQVDAIADGITQFMKGKGRTIVGHEGGGGGRWTLLDFGDIVFHVFYHPVREFYDLESLWVDAPRVALQVPPEAMRVQPDALY